MNEAEPANRFFRIFNAIQRRSPLIHNITNLVMQADTAAAIAAVGGVQMTLHAPEEARQAAAVAHALAVNVGTPDTAWLEATRAALDVAAGQGTPWLLDPVAAGLSDYRTAIMRELLRLQPTVVKGNASEILALAGTVSSGRAADSIHAVDQAIEAAARMAEEHGCIVAVTGAEDLVTDGRRIVRLGNGRALMGRMIGSGCMLSAVIACCLAVADDPYDAVQAAIAHFTVAGEIAVEQANGPGTLKPLLIDALYNLGEDTLQARLVMRPGTGPS